MSNRSSLDKMDVDREASAAPPSSPPPAQPQLNVNVPVSSPPPANGTNGDAPVPPPHRSNPSSPVPSPEDEAEAYKAAGNKFFKEKDYKNAIVQYTKGMFLSPPRTPPTPQKINLPDPLLTLSPAQPLSWSPTPPRT